VASRAVFDLGTARIKLIRGKPEGLNQLTAQISPGKYRISYANLILNEPKLSTGEVEIEVKEQAPPTVSPPK
jgi:hypothetical protein